MSDMTPEQKLGEPVFDLLKTMPDSPLRDMVERALQVYLARCERHLLDGPTAKLQISQYFHCRKCMEELTRTPGRKSPAKHSRLAVGFTPVGLQVWCERHNINICHVDYEGVQHPANLGTFGEKHDA